MKELCIVHIGMPKTGSSSLQDSLFSGLNDPKFAYANLRSANQSAPVRGMFLSDPIDLYYSRGMITRRNRADAEQVTQRNKNLLIEGFKKNNSAIEIVSGEDIFHMSKYELLALKDFLLGYFKEIVIIGYVRPPKSLMESAFQQLLKTQDIYSFNFDIIYHPYKNFLRFDEVFGRDSVRLYKFDPSTFPSGDITLHFCSELGIKFSESTHVRVNESLSLEAIALLFLNNKHGRILEAPTVGSIRIQSILIEKLSKFGKNKFHFSDNLINSVLERNKEDFSWIQSRLSDSLIEKPSPVVGAIDCEDDLFEVILPIAEDVFAFFDTPYRNQPITPQLIAKLIDDYKVNLCNELGFKRCNMRRNYINELSSQQKEVLVFIKKECALDPRVYVNNSSDLIACAEDIDALIAHYILDGESLNFTPAEFFDPAWYREKYPDVANSGMNMLYHFVRHGQAEGRLGHRMQ